MPMPGFAATIVLNKSPTDKSGGSAPSSTEPIFTAITQV
jgi:hypothetical protein